MSHKKRQQKALYETSHSFSLLAQFHFNMPLGCAILYEYRIYYNAQRVLI